MIQPLTDILFDLRQYMLLYLMHVFTAKTFVSMAKNCHICIHFIAHKLFEPIYRADDIDCKYYWDYAAARRLYRRRLIKSDLFSCRIFVYCCFQLFVPMLMCGKVTQKNLIDSYPLFLIFSKVVQSMRLYL